jgi:nucleoside-diphosphate-sugar epimerase
MTDKSNYHALVIGASGLIGWAVVNQLLQPYPAYSPFERVTALVNRPLTHEDSFWPQQPSEKPRLDLVSGVNLLSSDSDFMETLEAKVSSVESISHVYYSGELHTEPENNQA